MARGSPGNFIDLTGQRFGRLTVLRRSGSYRTMATWRCRCDCGEETVVTSNSLRRGQTKSCGCLKRDLTSARRRVDYRGRRFGRLVAIRDVGRHPTRACRLWSCRCDCGNPTVIATTDFGSTQSCGCLKAKPPTNYVDLGGRRFGRLVVLRRAPSRAGVRWICRCDCGGTTTVLGGNLTRGRTASCGCLRAERIPNQRDLAGQRFGSLVTVRDVGARNQERRWLCACDCGQEHVASTAALTSGNTSSCGCSKVKHGLTGTRRYRRVVEHRRREREMSSLGRWTPQMESLLRSAFDFCVACGATDRLQTDHVLPLALGHGLRPGNAAILCFPCNASKGSKPLEELPPTVATRLIYAATRFHRLWEASHA